MKRIDKKPILLVGFGAGATTMYFLDAQQGKKRRAQVRDQLRHFLHRSGNLLKIGGHDLYHRLFGLAAETKSLISPTHSHPGNEVLEARVRTQLGRVTSHPHAIHVEAQEGRITLRGLVLKHEVDRIISKISRVPGVRQIENHLEAHKLPDKISSLQGGVPRGPDRFELMQSNWSPAARILVMASAIGPLLYGVKRRGFLGSTIAAISCGFLARALTNIEVKRLLGFRGGHMALSVRKTIHIHAPVENVFGFWANLNNLIHFMPDILEVKPAGKDRFHWTIKGPAGVPVSWDAVISRLIPNELLAWRSDPGALVQNAGRVQFKTNPDGSTRIDIEISYNPPAGALGHVVAKLFGADPKSKMDEDLMRMKTLLEIGPSKRQIENAI